MIRLLYVAFSFDGYKFIAADLHALIHDHGAPLPQAK